MKKPTTTKRNLVPLGKNRGGANSSETRRAVLAYLAGFGDDGATDEQLQLALNMNGSSERPRRGELCEMRYVFDSGLKRKTMSGKDAIIWKLTKFGQSVYFKMQAKK